MNLDMMGSGGLLKAWIKVDAMVQCLENFGVLFTVCPSSLLITKSGDCTKTSSVALR